MLEANLQEHSQDPGDRVEVYVHIFLCSFAILRWR